MNSASLRKSFGWGDSGHQAQNSAAAEPRLLRIVDAGLIGVIFVAPYFFGGRHDLGRLVLVTLIAVTAIAWFVHRISAPVRRSWTIAYLLPLAAAAVLVLQVVPLPVGWLHALAPNTANLLPLWTQNGADGADFGNWPTLSLCPHETVKSLAMLVSYSLLFFVVVERVQTAGDADRVLNWIGVSAVAMAILGVLQYVGGDERFFWFYRHPYRDASQSLSGAFINRNHFAHFLVLGMGPLAAWLLRIAPEVAEFRNISSDRGNREKDAAEWLRQITAWCLVGALAFMVFAILGSRSRGGALAFLAATTVLVGIYWHRGVVGSRFLGSLGVLAIAVVGLLSVHGYDQVAKRLSDFTDGSIEEIDPGEARRVIWAGNFAAFSARPLVGAGAGSHRDILPAFLQKSSTKEFTHAENGYLQVATENGIAGIALLSLGIMCIGWWCLGCFRASRSPDHVRSFGAAAAGLAASIVHSCVDFVWYIPACISLTIVLAACVLRLSQQSRQTDTRASATIAVRRWRGLPLALAASIAAAWTVYTFFGPGIAAVYWDGYLRASVAADQLSEQQITNLSATGPVSNPASDQALNEIMVSQLEEALYWDPQFARARSRLAARYMAQFELLQQSAENALCLTQIGDVVASSSFRSQEELRDWLQRAFGSNLESLARAADEAQKAVALCPLQGEGYVYLADLCSVNGGRRETSDALINQALLVRPHDAEVLFEVGKQRLTSGNVVAAIDTWRKCFGDAGPHQLKIVHILAGRIPAPIFIATFQPDWRTLRTIWLHYKGAQPSERNALLTYGAQQSAREAKDSSTPTRLAYIWYAQAMFYDEMERHDESLACLQQAYVWNPREFEIRRAYGVALALAGRYAEAETHVRWALARRPADRILASTLFDISKQRYAQRAPELTERLTK